jgi:hypothetical protein
MNIEEKVKMNLLARGFDNKTQLNNRGLIGATIDETILEVVKNLRIADVSGQLCRCGNPIGRTECDDCLDNRIISELES